MTNAFIEPKPTTPGPITGYVIEFDDRTTTFGPYTTQDDAIKSAKKMGFTPLVARVRHTDKGNRDHWRSAD